MKNLQWHDRDLNLICKQLENMEMFLVFNQEEDGAYIY